MLFPIYINHILLFICHDGISQTLLKWYSSMLPTYLHKHVTNRQTQTSLKLVFSLLLNFLKWSLPCIRHIAYPIHQTKGRAASLTAYEIFSVLKHPFSVKSRLLLPSLLSGKQSRTFQIRNGPLYHPDGKLPLTYNGSNGRHGAWCTCASFAGMCCIPLDVRTDKIGG